MGGDLQKANSLLTTKTVPRFRKGLWEHIDDTITCENPYRIAWKTAQSGSFSPPEACGGQGSVSSGNFSSEREADRGNEAGQSGEKTLWAYPLDVQPLVVGHVLLDLCPSENPLCRQVWVEALGESSYLVTVGNAVTCPTPPPPSQWAAMDVLRAMDAFIEAEGLWDATGCFHRAGIFDIREQRLLVRAEDIGRHNCVDRLAGWSVDTATPLSDKVLLISARMTSSLCAKAIRAGFPIIVSRSAVTTAAIAMAEEADVTLLGFARSQEQRFTVFHQGRCKIYHAKG